MTKSNFTILTAVATAAAASGALYLLKKTSLASADKSAHNKTTYLLVGDIGGTNTRLGLYDPASKNPIYSEEFLNSKYIDGQTKTSFEEEIFLPFLKSTGVDFQDSQIVACFAVAGPVKCNSVDMTNLDMGTKEARTFITINGDAIAANQKEELKYITHCKIINDFVGQGYGLLDLDMNNKDEIIEIIPGSIDRVDPTGPKACVGAGTGLGECFLTCSSLHPEEGYECYPSEGGHVDFTPRSEIEVGLMNYLKNKFGMKHRISMERVVSGKGLANVYEYLSKEYPTMVRENIQRDFETAGDMQGRVVGMNANAETLPCNLCVQAMEIMASTYGAEVGNCAVKFIPTGGLYVSGGLTPKNIKFILGEDSPFIKAYQDKGRLEDLVKSIPLFAVMTEDIGLRGARVCALREYNGMKK